MACSPLKPSARLASSLPDIERLSEALISRLDPDTRDNIIVVGGQALRMWAFHYLIDEMTAEEQGNVTSDDLDFLGRKPEVIKCGQAWNVEPHFPDLADPTPNTGLIAIDAGEDEPFVIDFLAHLHGIKDNELLKGADTFLLGDDLSVKVLTPFLCLKSRIANLEGLHYPPWQVEREKIRITIATRTLRYYLIDLLEAGEQRKALNWSKQLLDLCHSSIGIRACVSHNLLDEKDPLSAIPAQHAGFDPRFQTGHYAAMVEKIRYKRASYATRTTRMGVQ